MMQINTGVATCSNKALSDRVHQVLAEVRQSTTQMFNQAFLQKINPDQLEVAQVKIMSAKRKMQMALAQARRNQSNCCDASPALVAANSEAETLQHLFDQIMRRLYKAAEFAMKQATAAITAHAFQRAVQTVLEQQEREKPHQPRTPVQKEAFKT